MNRHHSLIIVASLVVATAISFGRIGGNGFINFDDGLYITENEQVKSGISAETIGWAFSAVVSSNWHPFTMISHAIDWQLFKDNAGAHHLMSLFFHIGGAIFLFLLLYLMTGMLWPSAFAVALFALHPLRVESVAWAAERKDVLSLFFGLGSLYAYSHYVKNRKAGVYVICLVLFIASLLSKPMFVTLPFIMLLLDFWPLNRLQKKPVPEKPAVSAPEKAIPKGKPKKTDKTIRPAVAPPRTDTPKWEFIGLIREKIPFFIIVVLSSIVTLWAQQESIASLKHIPFPDRFVNAIHSYAAYLIKMIWPADLSVFYPYQPIPPLQVLGAAILVTGISIAVILLLKKMPFLFVGWFWYLGTLIPVIGLVQVGAQSMADRYTYLPSIGIGIMVVWGIHSVLPKQSLYRKGAAAVAGVVVALLSFLTWQQCGIWKDSITLYRHALAVTKNNDLAHYNLGIALAAAGKQDETIRHYREAIKIKPKSDNAHYNLGMALQKQGQTDEALQHFRDAVKINPRHADAHNNLAIILEKQHNKVDEAIEHYQEALKIDANNGEIHYNLGIALGRKGDLTKAVEHFRKALELKPDDQQAQMGLNMALEMQKEQKK